MRFSGRKGWRASAKDVWDLDATLSPIILAGLIRFREEYIKCQWQSVPSSSMGSVHRVDVTDADVEKFIEDIDEMIYAFRDETEGLVEVPMEEWFQVNAVAMATHRDRVVRGRELFIKYYDSLWI